MPEDPLWSFLYQKGYEGIFYTLNWPRNPFTEWLVRGLFGKRVDTIIDLAITFDHMIGSENVNAACRWLTGIVGQEISVRGREGIPTEGPVLLASNHPGLFDSMVITSMLPRQDLKIVAGGVHYFAELPNAKNYLLYLDASTNTRVAVVRAAIRHLQQGGCVLIFPTGETDPDPDSVPGARQRLAEWSDSLGVMLRRVPETTLVSTTVSGILNPRYMRHLIVKIQPIPRYRQRVAELLQIFAQFRKPGIPPMSCPRVTFGTPVRGTELISDGGKSEMMAQIRAQALKTLEAHQLSFPGGLS